MGSHRNGMTWSKHPRCLDVLSGHCRHRMGTGVGLKTTRKARNTATGGSARVSQHWGPRVPVLGRKNTDHFCRRSLWLAAKGIEKAAAAAARGACRFQKPLVLLQTSLLTSRYHTHRITSLGYNYGCNLAAFESRIYLVINRF